MLDEEAAPSLSPTCSKARRSRKWADGSGSTPINKKQMARPWVDVGATKIGSDAFCFPGRTPRWE